MINNGEFTDSRLDEARQKITAFVRRFGHTHHDFAMHAAFPLALTPDLLYRLWISFLRDIQGQPLNIPWVTVADILLAGLCREVGSDLYQMDPIIRSALLSELNVDERFGRQRIHELSAFLLAYVRRHLQSADPLIRTIARSQQWTSLAYVQPERAAREIAEALKQSIEKLDVSEQLRLASLVDTLAEPLADYQPLLRYVRVNRELLRGSDIEGLPIFRGVEAGFVTIAGVELPTLIMSAKKPSSLQEIQNSVEVQDRIVHMAVESIPRQYHGVVDIDAANIIQDTAQIEQAIVKHLIDLPSSKVKVRLNIEVDIPDTIPNRVIRAILENSDIQGFEDFNLDDR